MLFFNIVLAALAQSLYASAAMMNVTVGENNQFTFSPQSIVAKPGDMVAFNFVTQNHSVASSDENTPCQPQKNAIYSDFQPVAAVASEPKGTAMEGKKNISRRQQAVPNTPMFMVPIVDTKPIYLYCSQAQHCQQGMVMVINPPSADAVKQYAVKAAMAKTNVSPKGGVSGGSVVNNAAGTLPKVIAGSNMPAGPNGIITSQLGMGKGKGAKVNN